ncbi:MAG: hypothetical protein WC657_04520 [Candidatus Paceibacterota bacterium]|jgi:hypothetical protein
MQEDKKIEEYVTGLDFETKQNLGWREKLEDLVNGKFFVPVVIVLIAIIAFFLGRISGLQAKKEPVRVLDNTVSASENNPLNPPYIKGEIGTKTNISGGEVKGVSTGQVPASTGAVVASKNGTKYHYPWCAGAKQISAQNLVSFASIEEARAKGYTPASNCKGLK